MSATEEKETARTPPWEISDEFWVLVEPLLPETRRDGGRIYKRRSGGGRKAKYSDRLYFAGIVYVLRTGIIWNAFPREKFFWGVVLFCPARAFPAMGEGGVVLGDLA
jgi:transposase